MVICCFTGVAVGSGWQAIVATINIGSYYLVGVPAGVVLGWLLLFGFKVYTYPVHTTAFGHMC